jgi:hypothetical protein
VTAGTRAGHPDRLPLRVLRSSAFRFVVVGGASVVVDAGLLYVLHGLLELGLEAATALAFLAGFVVNFALNRRSPRPAGCGARSPPISLWSPRICWSPSRWYGRSPCWA